MSNGYVSTEDFEAEIQRLERKIEGIPQGSVIRDAVVFGPGIFIKHPIVGLSWMAGSGLVYDNIVAPIIEGSETQGAFTMQQFIEAYRPGGSEREALRSGLYTDVSIGLAQGFSNLQQNAVYWVEDLASSSSDYFTGEEWDELVELAGTNNLDALRRRMLGMNDLRGTEEGFQFINLALVLDTLKLLETGNFDPNNADHRSQLARLLSLSSLPLPPGFQEDVPPIVQEMRFDLDHQLREQIADFEDAETSLLQDNRYYSLVDTPYFDQWHTLIEAGSLPYLDDAIRDTLSSTLISEVDKNAFLQIIGNVQPSDFTVANMYGEVDLLDMLFGEASQLSEEARSITLQGLIANPSFTDELASNPELLRVVTENPLLVSGLVTSPELSTLFASEELQAAFTSEVVSSIFSEGPNSDLVQQLTYAMIGIPGDPESFGLGGQMGVNMFGNLLTDEENPFRAFIASQISTIFTAGEGEDGESPLLQQIKTSLVDSLLAVNDKGESPLQMILSEAINNMLTVDEEGNNPILQQLRDSFINSMLNTGDGEESPLKPLHDALAAYVEDPLKVGLNDYVEDPLKKGIDELGNQKINEIEATWERLFGPRAFIVQQGDDGHRTMTEN